MKVKLDPNYVMMAYVKTHRMRVSAEIFEMEKPDIQVDVVSPIVDQRNGTSGFSRRLSEVLSIGQSPSVLLVDHYAQTSFGRDALKQFLEAVRQVCPTFKQLPGVIMSSCAMPKALDQEAGIVRRMMGEFPFVDVVVLPRLPSEVLRSVLSLSQSVKQKYGIA